MSLEHFKKDKVFYHAVKHFTLPDLFPLDDLGLQQGIAGIYGLKHLPLKELKKEMVRISDAWRPHRTLAALYVWRWKDGG